MLDYGCGRGILAHCLAACGFSVVGVDVAAEYPEEQSTQFLSRVLPWHLQVRVWRALECKNLAFLFYNGRKLPFRDESFELVVAYAVLEHIADMDRARAIKEISRVLKSGGYLFISRLPRKYSYAEFLTRLAKKGAHDRRFGDHEMANVLQQHGFRVHRIDKTDMVPAFPPGAKLRRSWNNNYSLLMSLDHILLSGPLRQFAHHLRLVATKQESMEKRYL